MFNISAYLEKFKNFGLTERQEKEEVSLSIKEITGLEIETKNINIKNGEVLIKTSPAVKSVIYTKKDLILGRIKEKGLNNINFLR